MDLALGSNEGVNLILSFPIGMLGGLWRDRQTFFEAGAKLSPEPFGSPVS